MPQQKLNVVKSSADVIRNALTLKYDDGSVLVGFGENRFDFVHFNEDASLRKERGFADSEGNPLWDVLNIHVHALRKAGWLPTPRRALPEKTE